MEDLQKALKVLETLETERDHVKYRSYDVKFADLFNALSAFADGELDEVITAVKEAIDRIEELEGELESANDRIEELEQELEG